MNIFEEIGKLFATSEKRNDENFNAMQQFVLEIMEIMPNKVLNELNAKHIHPSLNKPGYSIVFSATDHLWWEEQYKSEIIQMKPIDEIKHDTYVALIDILSTISANDESLKKLLLDLVKKLEAETKKTTK